MKMGILYRNINGKNIPFPSAKNIFSDTSYTKENPSISTSVLIPKTKNNYIPTTTIQSAKNTEINGFLK